LLNPDKFFIDHGLQDLRRSLFEQTPVDENGGCAADARFPAILKISNNSLPGGLAVQIPLEPFHIQPTAAGDVLKFLKVEIRAMGKKPVVEFPELTLFMGCHCRQGRRKGHFMVLEGEVLKDNFYPAGIFFEHLLEERLKSAAMRSLEIAEDHQLNRRFGRPQVRRADSVDGYDEIEQ
jgi:hypothetical protein